MSLRTNKNLSYLSTPAGTIPYRLIRSSRRKTIMIRIDPATPVLVSAPFYARLSDIHQFMAQKSSWIVRKIQEVNQRNEALGRRYENGGEFPFLGKTFRLNVQESDVLRPRIDFDGNQWRMSLPRDHKLSLPAPYLKSKLTEWYRLQAKEILGSRIFYYARLMGLNPRQIAVRTQRRLWGSCHHHNQSIHLNWQIIAFPMEIIDYVIVHELCHLKIPNHSQRFWYEVKTFLPDFQARRQWLKKHALDFVIS